MRERIGRDELFLQMAELMAQRSVCIRKQVGAIVVIDNRVVSTAYNGPPSGFDHCRTCKRESCDIAIHAEINAIVFAAKEGIRIKGGTLYCTMSPCINCAKAIINSGIVRVVYKEEYRLCDGIDLLRSAGLTVGTIGRMYYKGKTTYYNGEWFEKEELICELWEKPKLEREPLPIIGIRHQDCCDADKYSGLEGGVQIEREKLL